RLRSNSAAKEWCAAAGPWARPEAKTATAKTQRAFITYSSRIKVLRRSLILVADEFDQFLIEHDLMTDPHGEGLSIGLRVVDCNIAFHVAVVGAPPALAGVAFLSQ